VGSKWTSSSPKAGPWLAGCLPEGSGNLSAIVRQGRPFIQKVGPERFAMVLQW
jgi:hypothetical protein